MSFNPEKEVFLNEVSSTLKGKATLPRPSNLNVAKNVAVGTGDTVAKDAPDGKTGSLITAEQPKGNVAGSTDDKLCTEDDKVDEPKKNIAGNN